MPASTPCQTPDEQAACWAKIREADARFHQIEVTWRHTQMRSPRSVEDVNKGIAALVDASPAIHPARKTLQDNITAQTFQDQVSGHNHCDRVTFLRDGGTVRATVLSDPHPETGQVSHVVDVFDGHNILYLVGADLDAPAQGILTRDMSRKLSFSAPGHIAPILLYGAPIMETFIPAKTLMREGADDTVILECALSEQPTITRMSLSTIHWRPVEVTTLNPANQSVFSHYTVSDYHDYDPDIWFPSLITQTSAASSTEYRLEQVKFGEQAGTDRLHPLLPPGTLLNDLRFGGSEGMLSRFDDSLLSANDSTKSTGRNICMEYIYKKWYIYHGGKHE